MKKLVLFSFLLLFSFTAVGQTKDELIVELSDKFCDCLSQEIGSKRIIWRKCSSKMLQQNAKKLDKLIKQLKKENKNFENELWTIVNRRLSSSCDKYNLLIQQNIK